MTRDDWPADYNPSNSPVLAHNEIHTALTADTLWAVLVDATDWPTWYPNARNVVLDPGRQTLEAGTSFEWTTFGMRITSTVREFVPGRRLGWVGKGRSSAGYHRWELTPAAEGGTVIITEEVQQGLMARLLAPIVRRTIERQHQDWLERLVRTAEQAAS